MKSKKSKVQQNPTTDTSDAAISVVSAAIDDRALRDILFAGIRTKQIEIIDGSAKLSKEASSSFISELAAALRKPIVFTPDTGVPALNLAETVAEHKKRMEALIEFLKKLEAAKKAIDKKYAKVGRFLGNPVDDLDWGGKDKEIAYRKYEHGAIYVTPRGTYEVHGAIYQKYISLGALDGFLGFPVSDEHDTFKGTTGRYNNFKGGSIYWTSGTGAWSIHGPIRDKWWQMGAELGYLGFPVSDVKPISSGSLSYFQSGLSTQSLEGLFWDYPGSVFYGSYLQVGDVKCWTDYGMNSKGDWYFRGHLRNDEPLGNVTTVIASPDFTDKDGRAFVFTPAERSLGGDLDFESLDDEWFHMGNDDFIRNNWKDLKYRSIKVVMRKTIGVTDIIGILWPFIAAAAIIFGPSAVGKKHCGPYLDPPSNPGEGGNSPGVHWKIVDEHEPCPPGRFF